MQKNGFVGLELIKIRSRLAEAKESGIKQLEKPESPLEKTEQPLPSTSDLSRDREWKKALDRRWDEFRVIKRDFTGRLTESLASLPEEIRIAKEQTAELQKALEKFASLLDEIENIDDTKWSKDNFSSELGFAIRKAENVRLEYLRITAKLKALHREGNAVEGDSGRPLIPEMHSVSWAQGFRIGGIFFMPLILGMLASAVILAIAMFLALRT
jgi:chromosome segregation ATPase